MTVNTSKWEDAGLYDPAVPGASDRLALLEYLTDHGATLAQMVEAHRLGSLPAVAGELVTATEVEQVSVTELAERSGVDVQRVLRALLAAGVPAAPDAGVPADLGSFMAAFERGSALMGDDAILAFTRVIGAAAMNIAEAAVALFYAELGPGTGREGTTELERAQMAAAATQAFTAVPGIVGRMVQEQFDRTQRRAMTERGWDEVQEDGQGGPARAAQDVTVALGFVDLVGSTAWAQLLSLRDQNLALTRFESAAWSSAVLNGGRVVKMIGDEAFFAAPTAESACRIAWDVMRATAEDDLLPPARGVVGIGTVTPREGDYFGPLVNLLARLVKAGPPGGVVVTEPTADHLPPEMWSLHPLGPLELRGFDGKVRAFQVAPAC